MLVALIVLEIALLVRLRFVSSLVSAPEVTCLFIILSQIVYLMGSSLGYDPGAWSSYSNESHPGPGIILYSYIFFLVYSSTLGLKPYSRDVRDDIKNAYLASEKYHIGLIFLLSFSCCLPLLFMNKGILWHNNQYLLIGSVYSYDNFAQMNNVFEALMVVSVLILAAAFALGICFKKPLLSALASPALLIGLGYQVGRASRVASLPFFAAALILFVFGAFRLRAVSVFVAFAGIYIIVAALNSRGYGEFGVSAIPLIASSGFYGEASPGGIVLNVFQGIFITSDGLDANVTYPTIYKVMSFSILPSPVDGWAALRDAYALRLSESVPVSGLTELVKFGPVYIAAASLVYWALLRYVTANASRFGALYVLVVAIYVQSFIGLGAYAFRGFTRTLIVVTVVTLVFANYLNRSDKAAAPSRIRNY